MQNEYLKMWSFKVKNGTYFHN